MIERQVIQIDTIAGKLPIEAPAGWSYDKTATQAWAGLVRYTKERAKTLPKKRDAFVLDGQIEVLSNVLASSIGMASHYWKMAAREITGVTA